MQTHGGVNAEAAILSHERTFRAHVTVDWTGDGLYAHPLSNLDPYIETASVDRSLKGSAPEDILLVEGSGSAELVIKIAGDYLGSSLASVFSPFNTGSPFSGVQTVNREIKYSILLDTVYGTFEYPKFVGNIRTITPNRGDNTVEITALDRAEKMRRPIQLPPWAVSEEHLAYGEYDSQLVRPEWVIDNAARHCHTSVTAKRPVTRAELGLGPDSLDGVQLWLTGNGSYCPTIGYLDNPNADTFPNPGTAMYAQNGPVHPNAPAGTPDPYGFAGLGLPLLQSYGQPDEQGIIRYWAADQDGINTRAVHYMGFTLNTNGPNATAFQTIDEYYIMDIFIGMGRSINVRIADGQVWVQRQNYTGGFVLEDESTKVNIPTGQDHVDIFVTFDLTTSSGSRVHIRAGANSNGGWETLATPITSGGDAGADQIKGRITLGQGLNLSDVFYATRNITSPSMYDTDQVWRPAEYAAVLDHGLNRFSYMPSSRRQEAWSLVQDVAAAEFGSVFWDEEGVLRFWNWDTIFNKRDTIVREYSLDDVSGLQVTNTLDSVRNVYTVSTTKKRAGAIVNVFKSSDINEFRTAARTTARFPIFLDNVVSPLTFFLTRYAGAARPYGTPVWADTHIAGFVVQYFVDGNWTERDEFPTPEIGVYFTASGYLTVRVKNISNYEIRLASGLIGEASPAFNFAGTPITEMPDINFTYQNLESVNRFGERTLELSGDWYQQYDDAPRFFETLLSRTGEPAPATDAITVAGDPRLQLGDVVSVRDSGGFGDEIKLQIYGIKSDFSRDEGLVDVLTTELIAPPGPPPIVAPPGEELPVVERRNRCPNPACAVDEDGYWDGEGRITGVTGMSRTTGFEIASGIAAAPRIRVYPGEQWRMSVQIKGTGGTTNGNVYIDWHSRRGYMDSEPATSFSVTTGQVVRVETALGTVPDGAQYGLLVVNGVDNDVVITACLYEKDGAAGATYFDGATSGAVWDGAAGESTSRLLA